MNFKNRNYKNSDNFSRSEFEHKVVVTDIVDAFEGIRVSWRRHYTHVRVCS